MEQRVLRLLGMALALYIAIDILFQISLALDVPARAFASIAGIVLMAGLPPVVLRQLFGAGAWVQKANWPVLAPLLFCFGVPLAVGTIQGTIDGNTAAALVLLPAFAAFFMSAGASSGQK